MLFIIPGNILYLIMFNYIDMHTYRYRNVKQLCFHYLTNTITELPYYIVTMSSSIQHTDSDEAMLEQALAMSMQAPKETPPMPDFSAMTEEEQIAYAMQMSLQSEGKITQISKCP